MVLEGNVFIEKILPGAILRRFTAEEMDHYRQPYLNAGEDRRPTLSWPRSLPIEGSPVETINADWLHMNLNYLMHHNFKPQPDHVPEGKSQWLVPRPT